LKRIFFSLLFLVFFGVCCWIFFFSSFTELEEVEIIAEKLDKKLIENIVDEYRNEVWFKCGSKNNFFLFPRKVFAEKIKNEFKSIREVTFVNKFPNNIIIKIEERQDIIIWCNDDKCFLLDERGLAFHQLEEGEREERFKNYSVLIDKSNLNIENNQKIENNQLVDFILRVKNLLKEKIGLEIVREIETPSLVSNEIRFKTSNGWQIYFNIENDFNEQINLLKEILNSSLDKKEKENLNYIDLRIAGKAMYDSSMEVENDEKGDDSRNVYVDN